MGDARHVQRKLAQVYKMSSCSSDVPMSGGRRRTSKNLIGPLKEGALSKFGYHANKSKISRHKSLRKAVRRYGPLSTFRKLQAVGTLTKRTEKSKSKKFIADRNWVRKTYM